MSERPYGSNNIGASNNAGYGASTKDGKPDGAPDNYRNNAGRFANLFCTLCRKSRKELRITMASGTIIEGQLIVFDGNVFIIDVTDVNKTINQVMVIRSQIETMLPVSSCVFLSATGYPALFGQG